MADQLGVGSVVGPYRITGRVGEGGMGVVWRGEDARDGRPCALKVLTPTLAHRGDFRQRFEREAKYANAVRHPNIVEVFDAGEADGVLYLAMTLVEGTDLKAVLAAEGALDPVRTVNVLGQIASALDAAHAVGLLHRDVKPGNILMAPRLDGGPGEHCYLTDFGLSKNPSQDSIALTQAGEFVGTVAYNAPETVLGRPPDHKVDIYSLGCVLFECLTGQVPFVRDKDVDLLYAHIQDPPPRVSEVRPGLPPALDDVVAGALAKEPADRPASCGEVIGRVRAIIGSRVMEAGELPVPQPPPQPAGAGALPPLAGSPAAAAPPVPPSPPVPEPPPVHQPDHVDQAGVPTEGEPAPNPEGPPEALVLSVTDGPAAGTAIDVEDELPLGRHAPGQGSLGNDPELSRRHARVFRGPDRAFLIEDLGSTNGTWVNGMRVVQPRVIGDGDEVRVGESVLRVQAVQPAAPPADAGAGATAIAPLPTGPDLAAQAPPVPPPPAPEPPAAPADPPGWGDPQQAEVPPAGHSWEQPPDPEPAWGDPEPAPPEDAGWSGAEDVDPVLEPPTEALPADPGPEPGPAFSFDKAEEVPAGATAAAAVGGEVDPAPEEDAGVQLAPPEPVELTLRLDPASGEVEVRVGEAVARVTRAGDGWRIDPA